MKNWIIGCGLLIVVAATGCVSKSELREKQRAAFLAGQQQGMAVQKASETTVWVVGNVRNPSIPWTEDLTLRKALIEADYRGAGDPGQIVVTRNNSQPTYVSSKDLLGGFDMPLMAGDRIEIRP